MVKNYFSAPMVHPEIKDVYYASFGIPKSSRQFVMKNGIKQIFHNKEAAELEGFRAMIGLMNKNIEALTKNQTGSSTKKFHNSESIEHVFSDFGKEKK